MKERDSTNKQGVGAAWVTDTGRGQSTPQEAATGAEFLQSAHCPQRATGKGAQLTRPAFNEGGISCLRWEFVMQRGGISKTNTLLEKNGVGSIPIAYLLVGLGMVTVRELEVDLGQCGRRNRFRQSPAQAGTVGIGQLNCSRGNVPKGQRG